MKKMLVVVMAVMVVVSCMCMTAFAAENVPAGTVLENGGTYQGLSNDSESPYVIAAKGTETITITGLYGFSKVKAWNGTEWIDITSVLGDVADSVTITTADYPEYTYYTAYLGDTMADKTITVTWTVPSIFDNMSTVSSAMWSSAKDAVAFVMKAPLAQISVIIGIVLLA